MKEREIMLKDSVTLMITRVPKPGREHEWEELITRLLRVAQDFPGNLGTTVLKPISQTTPAYRIIVRFDNSASLNCWETSPDRLQQLKILEAMESVPVTIEQATGLEAWFELPADALARQMSPPPRYKMMLASGIGVYLTIMPLLFFLGSFLDRFPQYVSTLILVSIAVVLLTYAVMPLVTRILRPWLYGGMQSR